jgi:hypothetical protein
LDYAVVDGVFLSHLPNRGRERKNSRNYSAHSTNRSGDNNCKGFAIQQTTTLIDTKTPLFIENCMIKLASISQLLLRSIKLPWLESVVPKVVFVAINLTVLRLNCPIISHTQALVGPNWS